MSEKNAAFQKNIGTSFLEGLNWIACWTDKSLQKPKQTWSFASLLTSVSLPRHGEIIQLNCLTNKIFKVKIKFLNHNFNVVIFHFIKFVMKNINWLILQFHFLVWCILQLYKHWKFRSGFFLKMIWPSHHNCQSSSPMLYLNMTRINSEAPEQSNYLLHFDTWSEKYANIVTIVFFFYLKKCSSNEYFSFFFLLIFNL